MKKQQRMRLLFTNYFSKLFLLGFFLTPFPWTPFGSTLEAQCVTGNTGGIVWRDFDNDGVKDAIETTGVSGVTVKAYDKTGTLLGTTTSNASGEYTFSTFTPSVSSPVRLEFSTIPSPYKPSAKGTNNGTDVRIVTSAACTYHLGVNNPSDYCQASPVLAVPCYIAGAYNNASNSSLDALVSFAYTKTGDGTVTGNTPNHDATFGQVGATWGLAYQRSTKKLFASAFQKRHVGFGSLGPGGIYQIDYSTGTAVVTAWLDVNTLAGVNAGTDPHTGLGAYTTRAYDPTSFDAIGKISIGDLDISEDGQYLFAVNLNSKEILKIKIADKTLVSKTVIPNPGCTNSSNKILKLINFGVAADATAHFSGFQSGSSYVTTSTGGQSDYVNGYDPNTTSAPYIVYSGIQFGNPINIDVPIANGTYKVTLYWRTNGDNVGQRIMDVSMEGTIVDNDLDVRAYAGAANKFVEKSYTVTVSGGNLDLDLIRVSGFNAMLCGMKIENTSAIPTSAATDWRPWALKVTNGKVYVGGVCSAQSSQRAEDLTATVYEWDGASSFTSVANFPLNYAKGRSYNAGNVVPNIHEFMPWITNFNEIPEEAHSLEGSGYYTQYPQPILADIEFSPDGSMIVSLDDRYGHQMGWDQYEPLSPNTNRYFAQTAGDILHFCPSGASYVKEGATGCTTQSYTNLDGAKEFFDDDIIAPGSSVPVHEEINMGGTYVNINGDVVSAVTDPIDKRSSGVRWWNGSTGAVTKNYQLTPDAGTTADGVTPTFGKAAGLGDVEAFCNTQPIEIGNYVWYDQNRDGVQDPNETPLSNITISLWKSGTQIASTTTSNSGEYYFSSKYLLGAAWTGTGPDTTLLASTAYEIRIDTSNQTKLDTLKLTTANSTANNGNDQNDSDASVTGNYAIIALTTGTAGSTNHTYDFGFSPTCDTTLTVSNTTICNSSAVDLFTLASGVKGSLTYSTNGTTWTALTSPTNVAPSITTTYYIKDTLTGGCFDIDTLVITVNPAPTTPSVSSPVMNICPATTVNLTTISSALTPSVSGGVFEWHVSNSSGSALVSNQNAVSAGDYYLFERSPVGCYSTGLKVTVAIQVCCPPPLCIPVTVTRINGN